jgi:2-oxoglutarate ferredoxin oxidoreductase subunit gamma
LPFYFVYPNEKNLPLLYKLLIKKIVIHSFIIVSKMTEEIIIAGFGGQGVLSMGKILAYSAVMQDKEVSWMPSYGPEMRGGTANVTVIVGDETISSPILNSFDTAIILNQQSLDKFEHSIKSGGVLLYDNNGITRLPQRKDIKVYLIEAAAEASRMKSNKTFNMIVLGAYLKIKPIVDLEHVKVGLKKSFPERHHHLLPLNEAAILKGMEMVQQQ